MKNWYRVLFIFVFLMLMGVVSFQYYHFNNYYKAGVHTYNEKKYEHAVDYFKKASQYKLFKSKSEIKLMEVKETIKLVEEEQKRVEMVQEKRKDSRREKEKEKMKEELENYYEWIHAEIIARLHEIMKDDWIGYEDTKTYTEMLSKLQSKTSALDEKIKPIHEHLVEYAGNMFIAVLSDQKNYDLYRTDAEEGMDLFLEEFYLLSAEYDYYNVDFGEFYY